MSALDDWQRRVVAARNCDIGMVARQWIPNLWRTTEGFEGPCPRCGGRDRFSVNVRKQVFNCRGAEGNDVIGMIQHVEGCSFRDAVLSLTHRDGNHGRDRNRPQSQPTERRAYGQAGDDDVQTKVVDLFQAGESIYGSHAQRYLTARGLAAHERWAFDLRFAPALPYWGYREADATTTTLLGAFPALLAAIRSWDGALIGVHRTYLDPDAPAKLVPPGDIRRNAAKKILGRAAGGLIRLSPTEPVLAIGEGIETSMSWYVLARCELDVGVAAGISLGNLSGSALRSTARRGTTSRRSAYDPDMERAGLILPRGVKEVILLQDGDSDREATVAKMICAMRRFEKLGVSASIDQAPVGQDFNDVLLEEHPAA